MSDTRAALLRKMPIFGGLNDDSLRLILDSCDVVEVAAGEYFFHQGDAARSPVAAAGSPDQYRARFMLLRTFSLGG